MRIFDSTKPYLLHCVLTATLLLGPVYLFHPSMAHAQAVDEAEAEQDAMAAQQRAEEQKKAKRSAPPSAIPGADDNGEDTSHSRLDLNPTAALFDAVNRGSLVAAKEALSRGADVNAKNVLDQTPLDLSIDLGRNDIMFLLLSMKTYNPDGRLVTSVEHETETPKKGNTHITVNGQTGLARMAPKIHPLSDGGHPQPGIGFLGFNRGGKVSPKVTSGPKHKNSARHAQTQMGKH
ncbi:ankyrin repeat domain-containing protein [Aristophania vespae]|uniref:ankyrin repeat domain-containing protein n=1 Tax=Aristophania vespae TaxID=2697033 RepID=UPI0023511C25|nr:ankyrin repeat domain-containing protein [Aristophania vespae]UMM63601.1 hypothetical protein DM15PD_05750 [Aristophania vespae]